MNIFFKETTKPEFPWLEFANCFQMVPRKNLECDAKLPGTIALKNSNSPKDLYGFAEQSK